MRLLCLDKIASSDSKTYSDCCSRISLRLSFHLSRSGREIQGS